MPSWKHSLKAAYKACLASPPAEGGKKAAPVSASMLRDDAIPVFFALLDQKAKKHSANEKELEIYNKGPQALYDDDTVEAIIGNWMSQSNSEAAKIKNEDKKRKAATSDDAGRSKQACANATAPFASPCPSSVVLFPLPLPPHQQPQLLLWPLLRLMLLLVLFLLLLLVVKGILNPWGQWPCDCLSVCPGDCTPVF